MVYCGFASCSDTGLGTLQVKLCEWEVRELTVSGCLGILGLGWLGGFPKGSRSSCNIDSIVYYLDLDNVNV